MNDDKVNVEPAEPTATPEPAGVPDNQPNDVPDVAATITGTAAKSEPEKVEPEPITYDFKDVVPSDFEFDEAEQAKFVEVIKDMNLSSENANAIAKYGMEWAQGIVRGIGEQILAERREWGENAKQELGADFDKTVQTCGVAVEHLEKTVPGIRQALNETGAGNRIEIIRAFSLLGSLISADPGMTQRGGVADVNGVKDEYANRYPNTDFKKYI